MKLSLSQAVLATVCYADVFSYPLTQEELTRWFIGSRSPVPTRVWYPRILDWTTYGEMVFLHLKHRRGILSLRKKREHWGRGKWRRVTRVGTWLRLIPSIQLVGVTGGLAMNNARRKDDADMFFIVAKGTLWTSRFLATLLVELLGVRRRPHDTQVQDKVCLNMFMSEDGLTIEEAEQDLFSAHEILQMRPLWEKEGAYQRFLCANRWVRDFLPNAWEEKNRSEGMMRHRTRKTINPLSYSIRRLLLFTLRLLEPVAKKIQVWYMKKRRTTEVVSDTVIRFHPRDARVWIKAGLAKRLARYNIPLDKVFYAR